MLFVLFALKPLVTALCRGSGASGGLFTPTMSTGAVLGGALGMAWSLAWPGSPPEAFAMIGAATLGDAIRAYWFFGPPDKPQALSGMDFVILDGSKARTLYAFLDTA